MKPPKIDNAPGLVWRPRRGGWEARWLARPDLVKRGWNFKSLRLLHLKAGEELTPTHIAWVQDKCNDLQSEMLVWGRGGLPGLTYDGTLRTLISSYRNDPDSGFSKLRYRTRENYESLMRRIEKDHGLVPLTEVKARTLLRWHEAWSAEGKVAMAHSLVGMLRTLFGFGVKFLECAECGRIKAVSGEMKFPMAKARTKFITAEHAVAVREQAHAMGWHSVALAQAFQFELMLRQKDVIGEWVPISEPGASDEIDGNTKWLRGIRWSEIDRSLILRHVTSKKQKEIEVDLRLAPMVMDELGRLGELPASGPVVVYEETGRPYLTYQFRHLWRKIARLAGVPDDVFNMDSRAGAITEATRAGAPLEHVRHAATHGDIGMTQRYARDAVEKTAQVMEMRAKARVNNPRKR